MGTTSSSAGRIVNRVDVICECGRRLHCDVAMVGKRGQCPSCKRKFTVVSGVIPPPLPTSSVATSIENKLRETGVSDLPASDTTIFHATIVAEHLASAADMSETQFGDLPAATQSSLTRGDGTAFRFNPGERVAAGRYEVRRFVGHGGMGEVYAAFDDVRHQEVALKFLRPALAARPQDCQRFIQEGLLATNCSHPNIARVYDLHQTENHVFLSMELLRGNTLRAEMTQRVAQGRGFSVREVLSLLTQLCEALEYIHRDLIHRDVKPENLWVCDDGTLKLMDFGIARQLHNVAVTRTSRRGAGTAYYVAPEQLSQSTHLDARADQYSTAVIVYELLLGRLPQGVVQFPHEIDGRIPTCFSQAIMRALQSDPAQRHASMKAFLCAASSTQSSASRMSKSAALIVGVICLPLAFLAGLLVVISWSTAAPITTPPTPVVYEETQPQPPSTPHPPSTKTNHELLVNERKALESQLSVLQRKLGAAEASMMGAERLHARKQGELESLVSENVRSEIAQLRSNLQKVNAQLNNVQGSIQQRKTEIETITKNGVESDKRYQGLTSQVPELARRLESIKVAIKEWENQIGYRPPQEISDNVDSLRAKANELIAEAIDVQKQAKSEFEAGKNLKLELDRAEKDRNDLNQELSRLNTLIAQHERNIRELEDTGSSVEEKRKRIKADIEQAAQEVARFATDISDAKSQISDIGRQIADIDAK